MKVIVSLSALTTSNWLLLTREQCCLCEQAWRLLQQLDPAIACEQLDIDTNLDLISRFGDQVPVLTSADLKSCLCWPFSGEDIRAFINSQPS